MRENEIVENSIQAEFKSTPIEKVIQLRDKQKNYFRKGETKNLDFRVKTLKRIKLYILENQNKISEALWKDLKKSYEEAYMTELSLVIAELDLHIKKLKTWARDEKRPTPLFLFPSRSKVMLEPLGVSLIIAPWNYPFLLVMAPLIGSISAGNCSVIKPSPDAKFTALFMDQMIRDLFDEHYVSCILGGKELNEFILTLQWDHIFFTGSTRVGKIVMQSASKNLTPITLELGGKSPCVINKGANIEIAARRIAWGKTINAGQTCIAPDYILIHQSLKEEFVKHFKSCIQSMFGGSIGSSHFYPRIINKSSFDRLVSYLTDGGVIYGGQYSESDLFISPTLIDQIQVDARIMQDEIFGPLLPILSFEENEEALNEINKHDKPLAFYYFGPESGSVDFLNCISSGGACINETVLHFANSRLPFGGVSGSGFGKYHGKESFLAFSNKKSVLTTPVWIDLPFRYPPFKYFKWIKKLL